MITSYWIMLIKDKIIKIWVIALASFFAVTLTASPISMDLLSSSTLNSLSVTLIDSNSNKYTAFATVGTAQRR